MAIITSVAPQRLGIMGGGTDVAPYSITRGGATVSLAINIRQRFTLYTDDHMWGAKNEVPHGGSLDFVYAFRNYFNVNSMHHNRFKSESDGGIESGLGSSAASAVAIVAALARNANKSMSREEIAELAWDIEVNRLGMFGGKQDQYSSAFGGLNLFEFTNVVTVQPFDRKYVDKLMPALVLFHTNTNHRSATIQEGFKKLDSKQIKALNQIKSLVTPAIEAIGDSNTQMLGEILDTAWSYKKDSNKGVSNTTIDDIYTKAKKLGAIGGKCSGAGGGGCMWFVVDPQKREDFIKKMTNEQLEHYDFGPDFNGVEVRII